MGPSEETKILEINEKALNEKVEKVLAKFLQPDFKVKNDVYLNLLLTHLTKNGTPDADVDSPVTVSSRVLSDWVIKASEIWSKEKVVPPPFILSFALNLTGKISSNEQIFVELNSKNIYENLIKVVQACYDGQAIVKLGFTNLLYSFLQHKSGLHWIVATSYWIEVINLNMQNQTIYVKKQGYKFITGLLEKTISFNELFCVNVVNIITKPIKDFIALLPGDGKTAPLINNKSAYDVLRPCLCFLCHILEELIANMPSNVKIFKVFMDSETWTCISKMLLISHEEQFSFVLLKIMSLAVIFTACEYFSDTDSFKQPAKDFFSLESVSQYCDLMSLEIHKGHFCNVIELAYQNHIYWHKTSLKTPIYLRKGVAIEFENQVMVLLLLPILTYSFCTAGENVLAKKLIEDEFRRDYVVKLLKKSGIKTLQLAHLFKARLSSLPDVTEYSIYALRYLIQSRQFYTQESGALVFQLLIYCLQDCLSCLSQTCQLTPQTYTFLDSLIEAIIVYIEKFNLTWKDSIVTICVMQLAYMFLNLPETLLDTKLIVQGLKLLNTTISKYMSPNMALLMDDTTKETVMSHVGPLLYMKCHNSRWEVRDSALEVIYTMMFNASNKYPAFQKMLLDADIPQLVLQMGLADGEPFVRSTAVRCLQVAILVPPIWERLLEYATDFHEKILSILEEESEGLVRKEVATLIAKIYDEHDIPQNLLSKVYDIMTHAAIADLHWEVKVNAIVFWDKVIKKHLNYQGMIDGSFPSFTFSKDNRKIVSLNETEVQKRLLQILHQLSEVGCLSVLVYAVQDDCDLEVSKVATRVMKLFMELLQKYQVTVSSLNNSSECTPKSSKVESASTSHVSIQDKSDKNTGNNTRKTDTSPPSVLDESELEKQSIPLSCVSDNMLNDILDASDMSLLQRIFNPSAQSYNDSTPMKVKSTLHPREFLQFMYSGIESYSEEKANWLSRLDEFGSLLDDILREYDDLSETNDMDCY